METAVYMCAQKEGTHIPLQVYSYNRHGQRQSEGVCHAHSSKMKLELKFSSGHLQLICVFDFYASSAFKVSIKDQVATQEKH